MNSDHRRSRKKSMEIHQQTTDPLEKVLRRIRRTREFPSISKYIVEINQKLTDDTAQSSASELANTILKDYALTSKLLKLVNSAFYGLVSGKVTTVTRAVVLLGYDNVRLAAVSLMLFEHFKCKSGVRDLKDATISSFWCGLMARELAKGQGKADPEEAFICAMLHQLGKLLVIYHMPEEYRAVRWRMTQDREKEDQAAKHVLGITYDTLGMAVARMWNFPDSLYQTMQPLTGEALTDKASPVDALGVMTNFANELCRIIDTLPMEQRTAAMTKLLERYEHHLSLSVKELRAVMASCLASLYKHADALQFSVQESLFLLRLCGQWSGTKSDENEICPDTPEAVQVKEGAGFRLTSAQQVALPDSDDAMGIIMGGIQEISGAMMGDYDINDIALMSLEAIYRALQFRRAILFIHDGRGQRMEARYGYGADVRNIVGKVTFDIGDRSNPDLFSRALEQGKDLVVDDTGATEIHALIPEWYRKSMVAGAFIFMPIIFKNICVGAYYADVDTAGPPVTPMELRYLAMLRNQLILGIKMGR